MGQHSAEMQSQRTHLLQPHLYRARNLVERFFNKIKQCWRIATRYDKLAANYVGFVQLASIRLWLRVNESTSLRRALMKSKSIVNECLPIFTYVVGGGRQKTEI